MLASSEMKKSTKDVRNNYKAIYTLQWKNSRQGQDGIVKKYFAD